MQHPFFSADPGDEILLAELNTMTATINPKKRGQHEDVRAAKKAKLEHPPESTTMQRKVQVGHPRK